MYDIALNIIKELYELGYESYIIGGYPRDLLLNLKSNDIDICTSANPNILKKLFLVIEDNSKFGSLKIKKEGYIFEITTFRIDLEYNGRYPKILYTTSLRKDLQRRDFTINTICIDKDENIIDLLNGKLDLDKRVIRCVGNCDKKIKEDPIRIMRAIRFAGKYDFLLEEKLKNSIIIYGYLLKNISKNKINQELNKMNKKSLGLIKKLNIEEFL